MWTFFNGVDLFSKTKDIGSKATSIVKEMPFPSTFDIDLGLLSVMVKSTEGLNANFHFPATGAVQNAQATGSYGGLVYAYSTSGIKLWQPPRSHGYLIYVNHILGGGAFTQGSNSAQLVVQAWNAYTICPTTVATSSTIASPTTSVQPPSNMTAVSGGQSTSSLVGQSSKIHNNPPVGQSIKTNSNPPVGQSTKTNTPFTTKQRGSSGVTMATSTKSNVVAMKGRDTSNNDPTHDQFQGLTVDLPWWALGVAGGVTLLLVIGSISGLIQCIQRAKGKGKVEVKDRDSRVRTKGKIRKEAKIHAWEI
ncbi:uncharacterized protein LOC110459641 [Mizuhopecten yessoensis]|uniref:uncharacterized protein LOC110459641 n=1 Tax=Mizuhopecten yessoensis TaxID=6573 RepID=UPI000B45A11B|nr:uncharacterized protein LOC110459641 [Mizuhopecten yessoensis]